MKEKIVIQFSLLELKIKVYYLQFPLLKTYFLVSRRITKIAYDFYSKFSEIHLPDDPESSCPLL